MKNGIETTWAGLLLLSVLSAGASAQEAIVPAGVPSDQIVLRYYTPEMVDRDELLTVAEELYGEEILVKGSSKHPEWVARFIRLDAAILIRDTAEHGDQILVALAEIENALYPPETALRPYQEQAPALVSFDYSPRYLSTKAVLRALVGFHRELVLPPPGGSGQYTRVSNMTSFLDRHMILVRETPERIEEIKTLIATIDVPVPQATFSFLVIQGDNSGSTNGGGSAGLPAELTESLGRMVAVQDFALLAAGVIRGSVREDLRLRSEASADMNFELSLEPAAFDQTTGELTLSECDFSARTRSSAGAEWQSQGFDTALSLRNGEYTVLGAVGSDPLFVVLRMEL